jgi:hypothetical protein
MGEAKRRRLAGEAPRGPFGASPVPGREDLTCPLPRWRVEATLRHAKAHPWPGNVPLDCPHHKLDTTAITEPGRFARLLLSVDVGYHNSGWFANSDYESCLHLSVSYPRPDVSRAYRARPELGRPLGWTGMDLETPADDEVRAWGLVFFGPEHAPKAWFEPAASVFDPYRMPNVVHLRLFLDKQGRPFIPEGEPYTIRPWADGSSPRKITEGRLGADVR